MQADSFQKLGKSIREQRIKNNLTISDISSKTRISLKMLNILENGERDKFIAPVLIEGFLRNYMKAIDSDAEKWVKQLKSLFLREEEVKKEADIKKAAAAKKRIRNAIYAIIVLCIIIAIYLFSTITNSTNSVQTNKLSAKRRAIQKVKKIIAKPIKEKQKKVPMLFTLKIKTAKEKSWIFYKADNNKSKTGFIDPNKTIELKAKNNLIVTIGNSKGTQIFFNDSKIKIPQQVIHLKCVKSGCSLLSASEWQDMIFQSSKNSSTAMNDNGK